MTDIQMQKKDMTDEERLQNCTRTYKLRQPVKTKSEEVAVILKAFPNKIPVIVDKYANEKSLPKLDRPRFLVPQEITMSQFVTIIRSRMKLSPNEALFVLVNNKSMLSLSRTMSEVYEEHKSEDGYLYITYASQEVFG